MYNFMEVVYYYDIEQKVAPAKEFFTQYRKKFIQHPNDYEEYE